MTTIEPRLTSLAHGGGCGCKLAPAVLQDIIGRRQPPQAAGFEIKLNYGTQVETAPPTIVLSTSAPKSVAEPYRRYLLNVLRQHTPFREVPIRLLVRGRSASEK